MSRAWAEERPEVVAAAPAAEAPSLVRNVAALAGGQVVTWSMTLLWTLVVPRALGPTGLGMLVSALAVSGILGVVLGLGTRNYLVREIVVDRVAAPRLVGTAIVLRLLSAPLFVAGVVVYARVAHYGHDATLVLYLVGASTLLTLLAEPIQAAFQAMEHMQYLAYSDILNKSAQSLIGIALIVIGLRAVGIAANLAAVAGALVVLNALWLRRFFRIVRPTTVRQLTDMTRQSVAYWVFGMFGMVYLWIDATMLSLMTRSEVVGWYGAPVRLFQTLMFVPVLLSTAWLPRLVAAFQRGPEQLLATARRPIELVIVLSAPIAAGTAMVATPLIHVIYGSAYDEAVPVLVLLALCIPPMYVNIMLAQVLLAAKRQAAWTWVMVGAAVVNPAINLVLIPATEHRFANGAIGAAVSLLLTELLMVGAGFVLVGRNLFDGATLRRCVLAVASAAAMFGVALAARGLGTPLSLAAGSVTFLLLAGAFHLATPEEVALVRARLRRRA